jgi:hypothetical protein
MGGTMLISVVVPTRDRAAVLQYCLAACARIPDRKVEFVVSDNASVDETADVVARLPDGRFRYVRTPQRCSMRQNFEFGVSQAQGDYIFTLGDDDAPMPNQFAYLRALLERYKPDTLTGSTLRYNWPGPMAFDDMGRIKVTYKTVYGVPEIVSGAQLRSSLERDGTHFGGLAPAVYRGGISRQLADALRAKSGELFMADWPDVYFMFASPALIGRHLAVPHPFFVSGATHKSNGASFHRWRKNEGGGEEHRKFLTEAGEDPVADAIPFKPSLQIGMLSHLESANRHAHGGQLRIDYEREFDRAIASLAELDEEMRKAGAEALARFASDRQLPPRLCDAETLLSRCAPVAAKKLPSRVRAKRRNYLLAGAIAFDMSGAERTDIDAATAAYEYLVGGRAFRGGPARLLAWANLVRRALPFIWSRAVRR